MVFVHHIVFLWYLFNVNPERVEWFDSELLFRYVKYFMNEQWTSWNKQMLIFYLGFAAVWTIEISVEVERRLFAFHLYTKNVLSEILFLKSCKWWKCFSFYWYRKRRVSFIWTCALNFLLFAHTKEIIHQIEICVLLQREYKILIVTVIMRFFKSWKLR